MKEEEQETRLYDELLSMAKTLLRHGSDAEDLEKHLRQKTEDIVLITVIIKEAKKEHYAVLRKEGLAKILLGSILALLGFAVTFFNFHTNRSIDLAMYGFTTTGIVIVFWGLFKMIG